MPLSLPKNYRMVEHTGNQPGWVIIKGRGWLTTTEPFESAPKAIAWAIADEKSTSDAAAARAERIRIECELPTPDHC